MIWMFLARSLVEMSSYGRPSNAMVPSVGFSRPTIALPIVDLPHPDSPTMPTVSFVATSRLTPSTALRYETRLLKRFFAFTG